MKTQVRREVIDAEKARRLDAVMWCDMHDVVIWRRRNGYAWVPDAHRGDASMIRDGFASISDAALDAAAALGLGD